MNNNQELKIIKYEDDNKTIDVRVDYKNRNIWLTQNDIVLLYDKSQSTISWHINNVIKENGELNKSVYRNFEITASDGKNYKTKLYNQEIILLIGYRIKQKKVYKFKEWIDNLFKENNIIESPNNSQIYELIEFKDDDFSLTVNVSPSEETVWLTQEGMALLFGTTRNNITIHINNIFESEELEYNSVCKESLLTALDGKAYKTKLYNLDMIISLGYRINSKRGILFRKWANSILKEYLLSGYSINDSRSVLTKENYLKLIYKVNSLSDRVITIENEFLQIKKSNNFIFFDGEFYNAYSFVQTLFENANNEIIIIDNYVDRSVLDRLIVKKKDVKVTIYTSKKSRIIKEDIEAFNKEKENLKVVYRENIHDRYIIIDKNKLYHLGHSIKDLGKKIFSINEQDPEIIDVLLNRI